MSFHNSNVLVLALALALASCGRPVVPYSPREADDGGPGDAARPAPELISYSPGSLSVGETLTLQGKGFATDKGAEVTLRFHGKFVDSDGKSHAVDRQARPKVVSSSRLTWRLWPDIVFHPTGDRLGRFEGKVVVTNYYGKSQTAVASNSMALTLVINPSLILRQSQPRSTNCQNVVVNTLEGKQWTFTVEAVGLRKATKDHPLTFYWGLRAKQWDIQLKHTSLYRKPLPKHGLIILEARGTGPISTLSGGSGSYLVKVGSDLVGKLQLQGLATGAISYSDSNLPVTVNAMAVDAEGDWTVRAGVAAGLDPIKTPFGAVASQSDRRPHSVGNVGEVVSLEQAAQSCVDPLHDAGALEHEAGEQLDERRSELDLAVRVVGCVHAAGCNDAVALAIHSLIQITDRGVHECLDRLAGHCAGHAFVPAAQRVGLAWREVEDEA